MPPPPAPKNSRRSEEKLWVLMSSRLGVLTLAMIKFVPYSSISSQGKILFSIVSTLFYRNSSLQRHSHPAGNVRLGIGELDVAYYSAEAHTQMDRRMNQNMHFETPEWKMFLWRGTTPSRDPSPQWGGVFIPQHHILSPPAAPLSTWTPIPNPGSALATGPFLVERTFQCH